MKYPVFLSVVPNGAIRDSSFITDSEIGFLKEKHNATES